MLIAHLIRTLQRWWAQHSGRRDDPRTAAPASEGSTAAASTGGAKASSPRAGRAPERTGRRQLAGRERDRPSAAARGPLALLAHQTRADTRTSFRNPRARFFTFLFPILLLVVFNGVFGNGHTTVDGVRVSLSVYYVPGILALSIVVASYASLVITITTLRETGVLKRRRATPAPAALLIAGQALATVAVTAMMTVIVLVIARLFYGVSMSVGALAAVACTVLVGTVTFACIAYAVSALINSPDAAQPIVQATMLPLWFISGVFVPEESLSSTLRNIGKLFPVEHVANSLHLASVHSTFSSAISGTDMLVLLAWAVGATAFATWRFSWLPSTAST
jgi:ABC-2 type transport system permease protein